MKTLFIKTVQQICVCNVIISTIILSSCINPILTNPTATTVSQKSKSTTEDISLAARIISTNMQFTTEEQKRLPLFITKPTVSLEKAKEKALDFLKSFYNSSSNETNSSPSVQSFTSRTISSVTVSTTKKSAINSKIKNFDQGKTDTNAYFINFDNNQGYIVLSGDERISSQLLFSETGSINDSSKIAPLAALMKSIPDFVQQEKIQIENLQDSVFDAVVTKILSTIKDSTTNRSNEANPAKTKPTSFLKVPSENISNPGTNYDFVVSMTTSYQPVANKTKKLLTTEWHQHSPFNDEYEFYNESRTNTKKRFLAGCVPIALAQIFVYHKVVLNYDDLYMTTDP